MTSTTRIDATTTSQEKSSTTGSGGAARRQPAPASLAKGRTSGDWRRRYARRLWVTDLFALVWVVYGTQIAWFGMGNAQVSMRDDSRVTEFSYWLFSAALIIVWMWSLGLIDSRSDRVIGTGPTEYARVMRASFMVFGAIAIVAFIARIDVARGYLLLSLPVGMFLLVLVRWMWRQWLVSQRTTGRYAARVLLIGSETSVAQIARDLMSNPGAGYKVVGACVPTGRAAATIPGTRIPIMGTVDAIPGAMAATEADTVVITGTGDLPPLKVKQISWGLEAGRQHLILAPSITDIAGPRIQTRPVSGLPLIHVETPRFSRGQRVAKRAMDLALSLVGVVLISPLLLALALVVKFSSPGPVLFLQTRVGRKNREFQMLKFRSMVQDAEDMLPSLLDQRDAGNEVLFKMSDDPRITRAGSFMRRYSLDELPQLFNVIAGSMSLVGPRPPLPREVEQYADHVHRRFLMKPGITGAWQVGGRSSLSWEDSVRLDLAYVENWSMLADLIIMVRTIKAASSPGETAA
ncbi:sugar transferase [Microbacterium profundi]|uniref:Sugar transferase n=1 Tax=Microbacterium profundi TaxID=450380 RepID=A0ABV3LMS8_9MICO